MTEEQAKKWKKAIAAVAAALVAVVTALAVSGCGSLPLAGMGGGALGLGQVAKQANSAWDATLFREYNRATAELERYKNEGDKQDKEAMERMFNKVLKLHQELQRQRLPVLPLPQQQSFETPRYFQDPEEARKEWRKWNPALDDK